MLFPNSLHLKSLKFNTITFQKTKKSVIFLFVLIVSCNEILFYIFPTIIGILVISHFYLFVIDICLTSTMK